MALQALLGVAVALAFGVLIWLFGKRADQRRAIRFDGRRQLSFDEIWDYYYSNSGLRRELVEEALRIIEKAIGVPIGKLRPDDRFSEQLAPERGWEMDDSLAELLWHLRPVPRTDSAVIETVDDFVRAFSRQSRMGE